MPLHDLGPGGAAEAQALPKHGYARTRTYDYLRYCERFGQAPWGGPEAWNRVQEAVVAEFLRVREAEEAR